jgi:hypothetical protein
MKLFIAVILSTIAATHCLPFFNDDQDKWIKFVDDFAAKDLPQFNNAASKGTTGVLPTLIGDLVDDLTATATNNAKLLPNIQKVVGSIDDLAKQLKTSWWARTKLRILVKAVDGQRDNESYYRLDAAREWVARRLNSTKGQLTSDMTTVQSQSVAARDFLDDNAQQFVQAIKAIVKLTDSDTLKNADQIEAIADKMAAGIQNIGQLTTLTKTAVDSATALQKSQK